MSKIPNTELHRATDPARNILVSASAGSGKTHLLVSRLLRMLLEGIEASSILAITFTHKAASEMQQRLLQQLLHLVSCDDIELEQILLSIGLSNNPEYIKRARSLYQLMLLSGKMPRISTFHGFCQELLLKFPLEAGITPGFELIESTELWYATAWDLLFKQVTLEPDSELALGLDYLFETFRSLPSLRGALFSFVEQRSDWWAYTEQQPALDHANGNLQALLGIDSNSHLIVHQSFKTQVQNYAELLQGLNTKTAINNAQLLMGVTSANDQTYLQTITPVFCTLTFSQRKLSISKASIKNLGESKCEQLLQLHNDLHQQVMVLRDQQLSIDYLHLNAAWFKAGAALLEIYQQLKQQQRSLDFADLEWRAYRLLQDPEVADWIQYKLDARLDHILVDEFQDTNPTQWQILKPLLDEIIAGDPEKRRSAFIVGDQKQSIYGFRRANPELQTTVGQWLEQQASAETIPLNTSWRSAPAIIDCINRVFTQDELKNLLGFETHLTHKSNLCGRVEALPLVETKTNNNESTEDTLRDPLTQAPPNVENDIYYREGLQVAEHILALIEQQTQVWDGSNYRAINFADILLLLPRRTHSRAYEQALNHKNIPFLGTYRGGLLEALEIRDIEALLELLISPFSNMALAHVLRSPLFAASHQDLATLALMQTDQPSWYQRLLSLDSAEADSPLARASRLLPQWRALTKHLPSHDLLSHIYHQADIVARYQAASPASAQNRVQANLQRLLELSLELDSGRYPSLGLFLAHLRNLRNTQLDAPDEPPAEASQQRVRILTIHAAKGLEAAAVYLLDSASLSESKNTYRTIVSWPTQAHRPELLLLQTNKNSQPAALNGLQTELQNSRRREDANLLYVAMTRAKQYLVISGSKMRDSENTWYAKIKNAYPDLVFNHLPLCLARNEGQAGEPASADLNKPALKLFAAHFPKPRPFNRLTPSSMDDEFSPQQRDVHGRMRGLIIHRFLYLSCERPSLSANNLQQLLAQDFPLASGQQLETYINEAQKLLHNPKLSEYFDPKKYQQAWNEIAISYVSKDGQQVSGVIDRLVRFQQHCCIIDYKTHRMAENDLPVLSANFAQQMKYYQLGVAQLWPDLPTKTLLVFTAINQFIELDSKSS